MASFRKSGSEAEAFLGRVPEGRRAPPHQPRRFCSFCARPSSDFGFRLVSGPNVAICEDCIESAAATLSAMAERSRTRDAAVGAERCGFCGKKSNFEACLGRHLRLLSGPRTTICEQCVALCVEILDEEEKDEADRRAEDLERLIRNLKSPHFFLRCLAAVSLGDSEFADDPVAHQALVVALADKNWRVRALAEATLSKAHALPAGYRPSFVGRLRSLEFIEIVAAKHQRALEKAR
jgi:ATP-dependent protease Clp ATPase subunit